MIKEIHGFKTEYDEKTEKAVDYLANDLDKKEARVFFDQAKLRGYAEFEDDNEGQYTLKYKGDNLYLLIRRN